MADGFVEQEIDAMVDGLFFEVLKQVRQRFFTDIVDANIVGERLLFELRFGYILDPEGHELYHDG